MGPGSAVGPVSAVGPDFTPWPAEFADRYRAAGYWIGESFPAWLAGLAARFGDRIAIVCGDQRWTYAELADRVLRTAAGLHRLGLRAGDRFIVQLPNVPDFFTVVCGLFRLGVWPVFALPAHRASEIGHFAGLTGAVGYAIPGGAQRFDFRGLASEVQQNAPALAHVVVAGESELDGDPARLPSEPDAAEVAFLNLSGGSTGLPKLIPRTHDDYLYSVRASAEICGLGPDSVYLCVLPVSHNFSLSSPGVFGTLHAGGRVVLCPQPTPEVAFPLIEAEGVTITALVPPLAKLWLDAAAARRPNLGSLRLLQVGGARLSDEVATRVGPVLGCRLQQVFGMAEGLVNYTRDDDPLQTVVATQGRPISPDDEIRIVDPTGVEVPAGAVGELQTRGPYTIRGYYRAAEHNEVAFTADGFYRTGDLVRQTGTGHLVVTGRVKDQINRGGEKIAPEEVENHLLAHPAVHDVALVGVPDPVLGERTCAFVVPRGAAPTVGEVRAFLRARGIAEFKVPDRVRFVDAFPETGVGKTSRAELRARLAEVAVGHDFTSILS